MLEAGICLGFCPSCCWWGGSTFLQGNHESLLGWKRAHTPKVWGSSQRTKPLLSKISWIWLLVLLINTAGPVESWGPISPLVHLLFSAKHGCIKFSLLRLSVPQLKIRLNKKGLIMWLFVAGRSRTLLGMDLPKCVWGGPSVAGKWKRRRELWKLNLIEFCMK